MRCAALVLVALALTGCETTAEKSAKLERQAKLAGQGAHVQKGLSIARESKDVKVLAATLVHSSEATAAVVTLQNHSSSFLRAVPIALTVKDARGRTLAQNNAPGLEAALVSVASLGPHAEITWVDDQLPAVAASASVGARVGEGTNATTRPPAVAVSALHLVEDPANGPGVTGSVENRSAIAQSKLVVYVLARRGTRIVAAARAVLALLPARSSLPFQAFFVGDPHGATLQASAPPTSFE